MSDSMLDPVVTQLAQRSAELNAQWDALAAHAYESKHQLSQLADRIATTVEEIAGTYDQIAATGISATACRARRHAERLRRFAEHERRESQRWVTRTPTADGPPSP